MKTSEQVTQTSNPSIQQKEASPFFNKENDNGFFSKSPSLDSSSSPFFVQPKLKIGAANDRFEQEADAMADAVIQQKLMEPVATASSISSIQRKCSECGEEIQMKEEEEEEVLQKKCESCEEEEHVMRKPNGEETTASKNLQSELSQTKGGGESLPADTKSSMETAFGSDFSQVKIHTNSPSIQLNQKLGAQAFTHGSDVYFNEGKYNPKSTSGKHLLAHELTHVVQQGSSKRIQKTPQPVTPQQAQVCYNSNTTEPTPSAREPEKHATYESWISSFHGLQSFRSNDTFRFQDSAGDLVGTQGKRFRVLGDQAADRDSNVRSGVPENSANAPVDMQRTHAADRFVDHPTNAWVQRCLPQNLIATAYQLRSDCADIAVILRHVWLAAHHRTESYRGWTVGDRAGRANQRRATNLIESVYSGNVRSMVNPYSDERGNPIVNFAALENLLHPGDVLVWEHHSDLRKDPPNPRRTGGHTQTISHISRDSSGQIQAIEFLQGNQPIFEAGAEEIRAVLRKRGEGSIPSENTLRNGPSRRLEISRRERGEVFNDFEDKTFPMVIRSGSVRTRGPIWTWSDQHTTLVAAGPPRSAARPRARTRQNRRRVRRITDWSRTINRANSRTLVAALEGMALEARSLMERDQTEVANQVTDAQATTLGRALGQRFFRVFRRERRRANRRDQYFSRLHDFRRMLRRLALDANLNKTNIRKTFFIIIQNMIQHAGSTIEEMRISESEAPAKMITEGGYDNFLPEFRTAIGAARNYNALKTQVETFGTRLWETSTNTTTRQSSDDRPLYWTRLQLLRELRTIHPRFRLSTARRNELVRIFENRSRGMRGINYMAGSSQKRILISGFDPFSLDSNISTSNPSGAAALALDGVTISNGTTTAQIESVIFPVRFQDFNDRMVEGFFADYLRPDNQVDMIMTISRGGGLNFEVERYATRRRSSEATDNSRTYGGGTLINPTVPEGLNAGGPEYLTTTLPHAEMTNAPGVDYDSDRPTVRNGIMGRGSGGGYLSNEIFYRVAQLGREEGTSIPIGHLHTPLRTVSQTDLVNHIRDILQRSLSIFDTTNAPSDRESEGVAE